MRCRASCAQGKIAGMGGGRSLSIDLAWFVALLALAAQSTMAAAWPPQPSWVLAVVNGPPTTLFAVLAGVGSVLAVQGRLVERARGSAAGATLVRGLVVVAVGAVVVPFGWALPNVLLPLGVAIALSAPMLLLPAWVTAVPLLALAGSGGWILASVWPLLPYPASTSTWDGLASDPLATLGHVTLTGLPPALTLLTYVLLGALLARMLLAAPHARAQRLVLGGTLAAGALLTTAGVAMSEIGLHRLADHLGFGIDAVRHEQLQHQFGAPVTADWFSMLIAAPASGSYGDLARTAGMALMVIGALGLLCSWLPLRARQALEVPRVIGTAPISLLVTHVVLYSLLVENLSGDALDWVLGTRGWALHGIVFVLLGLVQAIMGARGVLEAIAEDLADRIAPHHDPVRPEIVATPDETSVVFRMRLRAPIEAVWHAIADPQMQLRWTQDPMTPIVRAEMDVRTGGSFRWLVSTWLGIRVSLGGTYLRVEPPFVLVTTLGGAGADPALVSADWLRHDDGTTTIETSNRYATPELRERALAELRVAGSRLAEACGARVQLP